MLKKTLCVILSLLMLATCFTPLNVLAYTEYNVMFMDEETGEQIDSTYSVKEGTCIDPSLIPEFPKGKDGYENFVDDGDGKNHSSYSWDIDPATTPIIANTVFTLKTTHSKHNYNFARPRFTFSENDKSGLMALYECPDCGCVGEVGVEINVRESSLSQGLKIKIDGSAIGGNGIAYEGYLDVGEINTIVSLMQKVGVPIPGWVNTVLTLIDKGLDVADEIAERTSTCSKEGHLYGDNPVYTWSSDKSTCIATFTCTRDDCRNTYDGHTVDKAMNVTGPTYTEATCTEDGIETYSASVMFQRGNELGWETFETSSPSVWQKKYGHSFTSVFNDDATCQKDGTYTQTCSRCGLELTRTVQNSKLDHHVAGRVVVENEVPATCTANGSYDTVRYCVFCDAEYSRVTTTINKLGHSAKEPVIENMTEATCYSDGGYDKVTYCSRCDAKVSTTHVVIPMRDHEKHKVIENATASTCTSGGTYDEIEYCSICNVVFSRNTVTLDPAPHNYVDTVIEPTCVAEGKTIKTCSVCGYSYVASINDDLPEHDYVLKKTTPSTCSHVGEKISECSICGDVKSEPVAKIDHVWNDGVITTPATCEEYGVKTYSCTVCGEARTEQIENTGHNYSTRVVAPTCTEDGYTEYTCSNCHEVIKNNYVDKKGHTEGLPQKENEVVATCTTPGEYDLVCYCSDCGDKLSEEHFDVAVKEHDTDKIVTLPTCTEHGYTTYVCKDCGYDYVASFTEPTGHTPGDVVKENETAPTCTGKGSYDNVVYCTVCNGEVTRETIDINAEGHKWDAGTVTLQPTTTTTGIRTFTCTVCSAQKTEVIPVITVDDATPTDHEADSATINKNIQKPKNIRTVSRINAKWLRIQFDAVEGAQNYRVMYRKCGAKKWNYAWTDCKTEYYLKNLKSGGLYEFMFAAYKKNAKDEWERGAYSVVSYRYYYKAKITKVTPGKNSVKVTWKKDKNCNGYELFYSTKADMSNRKKIVIKNKKTVSYTIKKLKKNKTYYIRVRSIKKKGGKTYTGEFSSQKKVKIK